MKARNDSPMRWADSGISGGVYMRLGEVVFVFSTIMERRKALELFKSPSGHLISKIKSVLVLRRHIDGGHHTRCCVRLDVAMRQPDARFGRHKADNDGIPGTQKDGVPRKRLCFSFPVSFQHPEESSVDVHRMQARTVVIENYFLGLSQPDFARIAIGP